MRPFASVCSVLALALPIIGCAQDSSTPGVSPSGTSAAENTGRVEPPTYGGDLPLDLLNLPDGYAVDVFAEDLENARSIKFAGDGLVFVSTRGEGSVYAVQDTDGDMRSDRKWVLAEDLTMPNGVALKGDDLYVVTLNEVLKFSDIREHLDDPGEPEVVYADYPKEKHHGWKFAAFGPDGLLYIPVGAPCNICESSEPIFASITRLDVAADNPQPEVVASGVRNSVGFTWHPGTGEMWFTDNGRDWLGDDSPSCEVNHVTAAGQHFGYPYVHQGDVLDPEFGAGKSTADYTPPAQKLGAHVAPLGLEFVTSPSFAEYAGDLFVAEHGSWNRAEPLGYRISRVKVKDNTGDGYETFIDGWLQGETPWGRPVDLEWLPDGSLLISDDFAGAIYRVYKQV